MGDEEGNLVGSSFSLVRYNNAVLIDKKTDATSLAPTPTLSRQSDFVSYGVCKVILQLGTHMPLLLQLFHHKNYKYNCKEGWGKPIS